MKIKIEELKGLIKEEYTRQEKKIQIESKIQAIEKELSLLNEGFEIPSHLQEPPTKEEEGSSESIFDAKPGEVIVFNFQDVTIKAQKQYGDLFQITDAAESKKLKEGDYIKIQGNDLLQKGKKFKFTILREAIKYETNPLISWRIIKNK
jgi:hypothetical protein